jgi:hypothetical protein
LGILSQTYFDIKPVSRRQRFDIISSICFSNMPLDLLFANVDTLFADLLIVRVLFIED